MSDKNDIRIDVVGSADGFVAATHDAAKELDAVKKQLADMAEKAKGAGTATRYLDAATEALAGSAKKAQAAIELEAAAKRASQQASDGAAKASAEMGRSMNVGRVVQNTANQLTDFIVQVNGGTSATLALSQQLPQMLYMFGAAGAAIGVVAALVPNLVSAFSNAGFGAKTFADAMSDLKKAIGDVGQATKTFDMEGLFEEFNKSSLVVRQATIEQLRFQQEFIRTKRLVSEKKFGETVADLGSYSTLDKLAGAYGSSAAEKLGKQLGIPVDVARDLQPMLTGLKKGTADVNLVFEKFGTTLLRGNARAVDLGSTLSDLSKEERDAASASSTLSDALARMAKGHVVTKKEAKEGSGGRSEVDQGARLIAQLDEQIALKNADAASTEKQSAAEQQRTRVIFEMDAGTLKVTKSQRALIEGRLDDIVSLEAQIKAQREFTAGVERLEAANVKARQSMLEQIATAERETELYGLTAAQISVVEQARLEDAIALATERGATEEMLAPLREELALRGQLSEALSKKEAHVYDLADAKKAVEGDGKEMGEFAKQAAKNMQDAMAEFFIDPTKKGMQSIAETFGQTIQKMIAQAAAAQLGKLLFGDMDKTGNVGGLVGSIPWGSIVTALGFHEGGLVGAGGHSFTRAVPAGAFANAPRFHGGGLAGDEVPAILQKGERVLTKEQQKSGRDSGGQRPIVVNVNSSTGDPAEIRRSAAAGARTALGFMSGSRRYA